MNVEPKVSLALENDLIIILPCYGVAHSVPSNNGIITRFWCAVSIRYVVQIVKNRPKIYRLTFLGSEQLDKLAESGEVDLEVGYE